MATSHLETIKGLYGGVASAATAEERRELSEQAAIVVVDGFAKKTLTAEDVAAVFREKLLQPKPAPSEVLPAV